jgi:hypothetical protein
MIHTQIGHAKSPPGMGPFVEDTNLATSLLGRSSVSKESVTKWHFPPSPGTRSVESSYAVIRISDSGPRSGEKLASGACSWIN